MSEGGKKSDDPRFSRIYNDPKFKNAKTKHLKIRLDSRFSKRDLEIRNKAKVDKYGRKTKDEGSKKELDDFEKYFEKEDEEEKKDTEETEEKPKVDRARGEVPSDYVSSSDEYTSSESEDSEEEELDSDVESEVEIENTKPETGDASKTLAVVNLDWDHVKSADLMVTFSSFVPKGGKISRICIYPSEFGKERLQREEVEGPPKELFQKKNKKKASHKEDFDSDSDVDIKDLYEEGDAEKDVDSKALRQYQLERLRYYYAVVYCNNIDTARAIYENCDGTEYESTANMFDLRYVPDGMTFDDEPRDECNSLPKNYKPMQFSTDALQHSNVKLTWDETPADRVEVAKRAFSQKEIEDMDFKAYLASDSDESEEEVNENSKNKLKALVGESLDFGTNGASDGESEVDMEITFTPGLDEAKESEEEKEESTIEKVRRKEKERRKARKDKLKQLKKDAENEKKEKMRSLHDKKSRKAETENEEAAKAKAELELLMIEDEDDTEQSLNKKAHFNLNEIIRSEKEKGKKGKYQRKEKIVEDDFKPDLSDPRFKEVFEDHDFAIDPSQPEFKQTNAMKQILNERSKRSKERSKGGKNKKRKLDTSTSKNGKNAISNIVNKLKKNGKQNNRTSV
ncbi:hypothetical protein KAFR_0E03910 [Kazachstania africana CBS 2517]|uniref:Uncharacterized protein n=1 Tax=Kazachstania africana (strain ATCC 22294 / BCRC 22015 / CBS 2517 / CECT 1963 / NBRC 1671 / NRRL Y-8276) TaxID=1071382 RepID=H2AVZ2_KAZAF|nr:hypothetical protein KAFR_0E03910 [Kazachstania africana CBS 2517]CCF58542.1 hypothetical protein KAFR_0E03910 [Kazachstania africana CBS 2517]